MRSKAAIAKAARKRADKARLDEAKKCGIWYATRKAVQVARETDDKAYAAWDKSVDRWDELLSDANAATKEAEAEGE